jgi:hypothetical protein
MNSDVTENVIKMIMKKNPIMQTEKVLGLVLIGLVSASTAVGAENSLDFWDEAPRLFTVANEKQSLYHDIDRRMATNYKPAYFQVDHADKQVGDLSVVYDAGKAGSAKTFGFVSSLWGGLWELDDQFSLKIYVKVSGSAPAGACTIALVDQAGKQATKTIAALGQDDWQLLQLPLEAFQAEKGFDFSKVAACRLKADLPKDALVWLDGIQFIKGDTVIGVTDKPLDQRMAEVQATRSARNLDAHERATKTKWGSPYVNYFTRLYLGRDLEAANAELLEELLKPEVYDDPWSLFLNPMLCRLYLNFSSKSEVFPGRLTAEVEKTLLEVLWKRTYSKNDIHWARQSTWWLDGSENHDINAKACNLVSSRIFMNEPDYKDRIYPDYGFGGGYKYGGNGYYGKDVDGSARHAGGRANLKDGKNYNAADHYEAWLAFLKEYFQERAKRGFFVERAADGYMHHTLNFVDLIYTSSGDDELKQIVGDFFDLVYADWAQESISGLRGGMKGRHNYEGGYASITEYMRYYMGGPGNGTIWYYYTLVNDYQLPSIVMKTALDRQGLGCFEYKSRGVGEEENVWPRPLGAERSLLCDTESRFLKYSYVTPDYVLGAQMEHPAAVHSHLSLTKRWHGMIFAQSPASRIVTVGLNEAGKDEPGYVKSKKGYDMHQNYRSVQSQSVLITQQARRLFQVNPEWFPAGPLYERGMGVFVGDDWDELVEREGWIFVRKGNAYAAVKPILYDAAYEKEKRVKAGAKGTQLFFDSPEEAATVKIKDGAYSWICDHKVIRLEDKFSPVIIEAGRKADHPTMEDFIADILDNPITLYKTVVPGYNVLVYTGSCDDAKEIVFNAGTMEMPTVGGEYIDYSYPMTFDSPYLKSEYKSGLIELQYGDQVLDLDFSDQPWWKIW